MDSWFLQVVAITVFFLLATAFYVFLAPFLGNAAVEVAAIAVYSFVVCLLLIPSLFLSVMFRAGI